VALVYANDRLLGRTSVGGLSAPLAPGTYRLRVVRAGYKEFVTVVRVASDKTTELPVSLELAPVPAGGAPGAPRPEGSVTGRWWFWASLGAAVVGGGVAIWALTRGEDKAAEGNAAFSFDASDAHRDPIFSGR
jgi:hypothetical protein